MDDRVNGLLVEGDNITLTYDDGANTLTISGSDGGSSSVFGTEFNYTESDGESTTSSESWQQKLRLTTGTIPAGDYLIEWAFDIKGESTKTVEAQVDLDEGTIIGASAAEASVYMANSSFKKTTLTNASHTVDIDYRRGDLNTTCYIRNTRITLWRIS